MDRRTSAVIPTGAVDQQFSDRTLSRDVSALRGKDGSYLVHHSARNWAGGRR
jgi:hypothetical protein